MSGPDDFVKAAPPYLPFQPIPYQPDGGQVASTSKGLRILFLTEARPKLIDYLKMKLDAEDWHGVQDAASDLRDLDSEMDGLRY